MKAAHLHTPLKQQYKLQINVLKPRGPSCEHLTTEAWKPVRKMCSFTLHKNLPTLTEVHVGPPTYSQKH
jgi:hypothetical protein